MIELHNYGYALFKESETHLKDYISLFDSLYEQAKHYETNWLGMIEDEAHCWATGYVLEKLAAKALIDKYSIVY